MRRMARPPRGVSLIEAMVALAVMAFGTLGVLGVQTTLRLNADVAKQRNEAVRIAQETIEAARSFELVRSDDADVDTWAGIVDTVVDPVPGYTVANTSYRVETRVEEAAGLHDPRAKTVVVDVSWTDRSNQPQSIRLSSSVHGVPPALAGSLALATDTGPLRNPGRRHPAIPPDAEAPQQDGTSRYAPPGADGVRWVFNNVTGYITQMCLADACTPVDARLLAGHVRFATAAAIDGREPVGADAEVPPGVAFPVGMTVHQTLPTLANRGGRSPTCYQRLDAGLGAVAYFCAVPVGATGAWSGRSLVLHPDIAANLGETSAAKLRICRYTPYREHRTVGPNRATQMRNDEHPLDYADVRSSLINQNFLVINAGNGIDAFDCPTDEDGSGTPFLDGRTYRHQPAS